MADARLYQLGAMAIEKALAGVLERLLGQGRRALVRGASEERIEALSAALWTLDPASFLPHGTARDGHAAAQPVYLTTGDENPNGADALVVVDGAAPAAPEAFAHYVEIFKGADAATDEAIGARADGLRRRGFRVSVFRQRPGGWERG